MSDRPEGPFEFVSTYDYPEGHSRDNGIFNDPGVLVDDDGRVYIYCGFMEPYMAELNGDNMIEVLPGTHKIDHISNKEPFSFFEASSPRKVGDTYYACSGEFWSVIIWLEWLSTFLVAVRLPSEGANDYGIYHVIRICVPIRY